MLTLKIRKSENIKSLFSVMVFLTRIESRTLSLVEETNNHILVLIYAISMYANFYCLSLRQWKLRMCSFKRHFYFAIHRMRYTEQPIKLSSNDVLLRLFTFYNLPKRSRRSVRNTIKTFDGCARERKSSDARQAHSAKNRSPHGFDCLLTNYAKFLLI